LRKSVSAASGQAIHSRGDHALLLVAEETAFAAVWVQRGHGDPWPPAEHRGQQRSEPFARVHDVLSRKVRKRVSERFVERDMHHAEARSADTGRRGRGEPEHHGGR